MVIAILLLNCLFFWLKTEMPAAAQQRLVEATGAIPFEITHMVDTGTRDMLPPPLTILSSMFMHGTLSHLLGNMVILFFYGKTVEKELGAGRFLALYIVAGVAGAATHCFFNADSTNIVIGASGGIAGLMGAYMVMRPKAALFLALWFGAQFLESGGTSSVAWLAHVGGFAAGFMLMPRPAKRAARLAVAHA